MNIDTCAAIARAVTTGMPLLSRIVTVTGRAFARTGNFRVRIGTPVKDVVAYAGGFAETPEKVILGGPMMGAAIHTLDVPVIKGTGAILALTGADIGALRRTNCIRCGKCVQVCPMRLLPARLVRYSERFDAARLEKLHVMECIECGACSYICPARKDPLQSIRIGKQRLRKAK